MKLYELTKLFAELFENFESISEWIPNEDDRGNFIDEEGNKIEDAVEYKESMLTAWFDTLQGIEEEFEIKAESVASYIKKLNAEVSALTTEKKRLDARIKSKSRAVESLTSYLLTQMETIGREKIDMPKALICIRTNPESTTIEDEKAFVEWAMVHNPELLKYSMPEPKKTAIKQLLKNGEEVPFARLERKRKIEIK